MGEMGNGNVSGYRDLLVWQNSMELAERIYSLTKNPSNERFGLISQMTRAAVSVPSNIEEGHGRNTTGEYIQQLVNLIKALKRKW